MCDFDICRSGGIRNRFFGSGWLDILIYMYLLIVNNMVNVVLNYIG